MYQLLKFSAEACAESGAIKHPVWSYFSIGANLNQCFSTPLKKPRSQQVSSWLPRTLFCFFPPRAKVQFPLKRRHKSSGRANATVLMSKYQITKTILSLMTRKWLVAAERRDSHTRLTYLSRERAIIIRAASTGERGNIKHTRNDENERYLAARTRSRASDCFI